MVEGPAHPGPNDGSGPLVWIVGGACIALVGLIIRMGFATWDHGQAFLYVMVGAGLGFLVYLFRRRNHRGRR